MFKKILVPLDGSKVAEKILPHVEKIARCCKPEVHLFQVVVSYEIDPKKEREERNRLLGGSREYLEKIASRMRGKRIRTRAAVAYGKDAVQICDFARKNRFDLVAMASHGRSGLTRWALGSVTD